MPAQPARPARLAFVIRPELGESAVGLAFRAEGTSRHWTASFVEVDGSKTSAKFASFASAVLCSRLLTTASDPEAHRQAADVVGAVRFEVSERGRRAVVSGFGRVHVVVVRPGISLRARRMPSVESIPFDHGPTTLSFDPGDLLILHSTTIRARQRLDLTSLLGMSVEDSVRLLSRLGGGASGAHGCVVLRADGGGDDAVGGVQIVPLERESDADFLAQQVREAGYRAGLSAVRQHELFIGARLLGRCQVRSVGRGAARLMATQELRPALCLELDDEGRSLSYLYDRRTLDAVLAEQAARGSEVMRPGTGFLAALLHADRSELRLGADGRMRTRVWFDVPRGAERLG